MKKYIMGMTTIIGFILSVSSALAYTGLCTAVGGTHNYVFDKSEDISDAGQNSAGTIIKDFISYAIGGSYNTSCDRPDDYEETFIHFGSDLPVYQVIDGVTWYKISDYFAISMQGYVAGENAGYFDVPFTQSNRCSSVDCPPGNPWTSGSAGKVSLMVLKPFVGFEVIDDVIDYVQASGNSENITSGEHLSQVHLHATVTVPQSCELNGGERIQFNFGNIGASQFFNAGAGNKPDGVDPQTQNIEIQCKNIDAQSLLSMRLEAETTSGNIMVSDNKDLGFIVADKNKGILTPNDISSVIPFRLDANAAASVPIMAWPVSVTGKKPDEGEFTAEGYLRVDFD